MSSFNGVNIFGAGPHWILLGPALRVQQLEKPPATEGVMCLDMGLAGREITVTGPRGFALMRCASEAVAKAQINAINAYLDGQTYTLVDNHNRSFGNVKMVEYREPSRWMYVRGANNALQVVVVPYTVRLVQLAPG